MPHVLGMSRGGLLSALVLFRSAWRRSNRPVRVAELPLAIAALCHARKEPVLGRRMAFLVHPDLVPRTRHDGELWREWIYAQIISPLQLDALNSVREFGNPLRCGFPVGEQQ